MKGPKPNNTGAMLTKELMFGGRLRKIPGLKTISHWQKVGWSKATDGCKVHNQAQCPHGHKSWLVELGYAGKDNWQGGLR